MAASFSRQFMRAEKLAAMGRSYEKGPACAGPSFIPACGTLS